MGSAALADAVSYPGKVNRVSRKGQGSKNKIKTEEDCTKHMSRLSALQLRIDPYHDCINKHMSGLYQV